VPDIKLELNWMNCAALVAMPSAVMGSMLSQIHTFEPDTCEDI